MTGFNLRQVSAHVHVVETDHVNWGIYDGSDGVILIDSGYYGQRDLLESSLARIGRRPGDVVAIVLTHAHADHLGGAAWMAAENGTPVHTGPAEVAHAQREFLQQVSMARVLRSGLRPGVLRWAASIAPLLGGDATRGVPTATAVPMLDGRADLPGSPRVRTIPGHTSGHTIYAFEEEGVVFTGDALVTAHATSRRRGPQLLPSMFHADLALATASLTLLETEPERIVAPGHGPVWEGSVSDAVAAARAASSERASPRRR